MAGSAFYHPIQQSIRPVVVGPTGVGVCFVYQTSVEGAKRVRHSIIQPRGHAKLMADSDVGFLCGGAVGPALTEVGRRSVGNGQKAFLLRHAGHEGRDGFAGRSPLPRGGGGVGTKVFFQHYLTVLQQDEGLGVLRG